MLTTMRRWAASRALDKIINGPKFKGQFLFILGCGRSGNTILRRQLMSAYPIYIPAETYIIPEAVESFRRSRGLHWNERVRLVLSAFQFHSDYDTMSRRSLTPVYKLLCDYPLKERSFGSIVYEIFKYWATDANVDFSILGDKTPMNILSVRSLFHEFPNAKFLFISRNVYDVCYSYVKMGMYNRVEDPALRWRRSHEAWAHLLHSASPSATYSIKYEDLVCDNQAVLDCISSWLELPSRTVPLSQNTFWGDIDRYKHHSNALKDINTNSIGLGRSKLSPKDAYTIEQALKGFSENDHYQLKII